MTYSETLDWMFAQLPMYQKRGKTAYTGKLDNIKALCTRLGHPEGKFKSIHIAGTNGKGSSSHMLAAILQEAGYKTGLYTSPHLKDFRERIRIDGKKVAEAFVVDFIREHREFFEQNGLSFFEMCVGMAFAYFAQEEVEVAVIEVGLGGRLDSTNVIRPEVSLITNIGMDHMELLGNTLEKIAVEKAGIIKAGVPVVISETQQRTAPIFRRIARNLKSTIVFADQEIENHYPTSLLGEYQQRNIKGVMAVCRELNRFALTDDHLQNGLLRVVEHTGLLGRWQTVGNSPKTIFDTAHNAEGLALVLKQLMKEKDDELHMVLGFVKEKDLDSLLPLFPKEARYYWAKPDIPRGLEVEILRKSASGLGLEGKGYPSVQEALQAARDRAKDTDLIFVGGSTFTVAEVM
ncbi:MAG: folylpolyglutamate synthase/dihydrofolate synthase family protein [Bacteroidota bacterium]